MKKSVFKQLRIGSSLIWSAILCAVGFFLIVIGSIPIDYSKEFPGLFFNLFNKTHSYFYFCLLSLAYCVLVACLTRCGTKAILESSRLYRGLILVSSRIISIGLVLNATLLGLGLGLYPASLFQPNIDLLTIADEILIVGVFFVLYNLTMIFFIVFFLNQNISDRSTVNIFGILFACVSVLIMNKLQLDIEMFTAVGNLVIFVLGAMVLDFSHRFSRSNL